MSYISIAPALKPSPRPPPRTMNAEITHVLTNQGGLPSEIASNIIDTKNQMQKVKLVKQRLWNLEFYCSQDQGCGGWPLNSFWDIFPMIDDVYANRDMMFEPWFAKYHTFLFTRLLPDLKMNLRWYLDNQMQRPGGATMAVYQQADQIQKLAINPLEEMKKTYTNKKMASWR